MRTSKPVQRLQWGDPAALKLMKENKPVILIGTGLLGGSLKKWGDLEYLSKHISTEHKFHVYSSAGRFLYVDEDSKKASGQYVFESEVTKSELPFKEFCRAISKGLSSGSGGRRAGATSARGGEERDAPRKKVYLQQPLYEGIGEKITNDFREVPWSWVENVRTEMRFGPLRINMLLVAEPETVTPCHYDEQHNLLGCMSGRKHCILFDPVDFSSLYPFPVFHPADRQSQVNIHRPDEVRFPNFSAARPYTCCIEPLDLLYIPPYWWHQIEHHKGDSPIVGINFWFQSMPRGADVPATLSSATKVSVSRNVEKMVASDLGVSEAAMFWRDVTEESFLCGKAALRPSTQAYYDKVLQCLGLLMQPTLVQPFFREMFVDRFRLKMTS